ncbi:putative nucleotidyltransferase, Ribonuclease H [Helianthus annuus]|nr:putative nucleotidyltransferase, Ribonuclease H [Helianthus annuus]
MVQTRNSTGDGSNSTDAIAVQLAAIAAKLESIDTMKEDIAALKAGEHSRGSKNDERESSWRGRQHGRPYNKIDFPTFSGGDPRGWLIKAEKYFRYYHIPDEERVEVASMHLEGDALDLYSWLSNDQPITFWEELVQLFTRNFGPAEFQNPDEFLCSIKQTGTVQEYRQEFAKRSSRVSNWPDHCLLGVFLNGLKDELKSDVRIHKPRTVYNAMSLALEFESKLSLHRPGKNTLWTSKTPPSDPKQTAFTLTPTSAQPKITPRISEAEKQNRFLKGECFRCGDKYGPGHRCKTGTLKVIEVEEDMQDSNKTDLPDSDGEQEETAEISLHAILGKPHPTTMKVHGMLHSTEVLILIDGGSTHNFISDVLVNELKLASQPVAPFGVQIGNGDVIRCSHICKNLSIQVNDLKITQDFHPFSLGGADLVLGIQWLATLNTVQANWKEMFMIFSIDGKQYKLQGVSSGPQKSSSFQHLAIDQEITPHIPTPLQPIVNQYNTVFEEPQHLPPVRSRTHSIPLVPNSTPPNIRPYRYPHSQKTEIEKQVEQLLTAGFIQPSTSPFSSPVLLVRIKDNAWRMCVDYRALNKITVADKYPIPNIDELLDELYGATVFSKLDLRSGYYQIRMADHDVEKTAFRTHSGHYEFKVMPFGLTNAPSTFQAIMNDLFRPYLRRFILVFFDDILIYSPSLEQHQSHLEQALKLLHDNRFFAKLSKCCFGQEQVVFLGHLINAKGVSMEEEKIAAIKTWPVPSTVKEVRGFLGLTGYYRRFVRNYGLIARPLTALTKKDGFIWSEAALKAFNDLKQALLSTPVLRLPDFSKPFVIECDASSDGVGAILSQEDHPVAYFSKGFSPSNRLKSAYDRELLALVMAVQKWSHYLLGRHFLIRTDHYTLKFLLEQRITTADQQRLLLKLLPYDFSIVHKAGKENRGADALSRRPHSGELLTLMVPYCIEMSDIKTKLKSDPFTSNLIKKLQEEPFAATDFSLVDQMLFYQGRLVIPEESSIRLKLLQEAHDTPIGGHGGFLKTYKRLSSRYYWLKMKQDVKLFVQQCVICQQQKYQTLSPAGLLQPLPIPNQIWEDISMDFIIGLPPSSRFDTILVVVDRLSKYAHFLSLSHPFTAKGVASVFCKEIIRLHGFPRSIVSDRDVVFLSNFWQELFRLSQTKLKLSTSYHPQTDGQTEVLNRCLEAYLRCFASEQPTKWSTYLPWAEYSYNTGYHTSTGTTPFSIVYGREPPSLVPYVAGETKNAELEQQLIDRDDMLKLLRQNLQKAQDRMRNQANLKRRELTFQIGDYVFLKIQPYRQKSLAKRRYEKLSPRFFGPYRVKKTVGSVSYELELPPEAKIHPVFHISMLKPAHGSFASGPTVPLPITKDWEVDLQPSSIITHRWVQEAGQPILELLVSWRDRPVEESTWETYDLMAEQFPDFRLEDKAFYREGSNDKVPLKVYSRKKNKTAAANLEEFNYIFGSWFNPLGQINQ